MKGWTIPDLLQLAGGYWSVCTLHAAVKLDVFSRLEQKSKSVAELSKEIHCDVRAMDMLLNALAALELIEKSSDGFLNTAFSAEHLVKSSPGYMGHIILHHHHLISSWTRLDRAVMSGQADCERLAHVEDEQVRENFELGMFNLAMHIAPQVAQRIDLGSRRMLLDLGGGPGTYSVHFCLHNPELRAVVFDLPSTAPFAEKTIARFGLDDRISFMAGDFIDGEIPGRYDAAWLSHILHGAGEDASALILRKSMGSIISGGEILVQEFILDDCRHAPIYPALFSLNMLLGTPQGRSFTQSELIGMLMAAGAVEVRRLDIELPNGAGVIAGKVT